MDARQNNPLFSNNIKGFDQMKTNVLSSQSVRLSQSEAMLEAVQAGFFEVFFEKNDLFALLAHPQTQFIRFQSFSLSKAEKTLIATALNENGQCIPAVTNYLLGEGIIPTGKTSRRAIRCCVNFHVGELLQLLMEPESAGVRLFPGMQDHQKTLIAVAVDHRGFDIERGAGYIRINAQS